MTPQEYCLRWKYHHSNVQSMFAQLLEKERFCDVTLYCSPSFLAQVPNNDTVEPQNIRGVSLRAHRVVLAACSELLATLLGAHEAQGEPVLVIDGAEPKHLKALLDYMYTGEMNVHHSQLASLLKTAEELRIKGLTDIRWNNKDEPPDCASGAVAATAIPRTEKLQEKTELKKCEVQKTAPKCDPKPVQKSLRSPERASQSPILDMKLKKDVEEILPDKSNLNGGPPPLIKLPVREKSVTPKRDNNNSDSDSPSPKRQRLASGTENTDDESICTTKTERDNDWQHGNLDITAERVVGWGGESAESRESDEEWADAPADIGSFLHTRLRVDGDNSADEESSDSGASSRPASTAPDGNRTQDIKPEPVTLIAKPTMGPKSGPSDPRFQDVVKLNDYLQHGRRPQFWEEHYVKRVMEAVRLKELEMKQAAEILGVSYGTLYGRYRDVYGCINRPYRAVRDFWQVKGPSEVLERLQRGELTLDAAASALGVSVANLAAHVADFGQNNAVEFEPIPIEVDPSLRTRTYSAGSASKVNLSKKPNTNTELKKKVLVGSANDDESRPISIISTADTKTTPATPAKAPTVDKPLSNAEKCKNYRKRKKAAKPKIIKKIATSAERSRMYRLRKKRLNQGIKSPVDEVLNTPSTSNPLEPTPQPVDTGGKWPTIRVANIESLRSEPATSPTQLMKTRPDLTIVAAKRQDKDEET